MGGEGWGWGGRVFLLNCFFSRISTVQSWRNSLVGQGLRWIWVISLHLTEVKIVKKQNKTKAQSPMVVWAYNRHAGEETEQSLGFHGQPDHPSLTSGQWKFLFQKTRWTMSEAQHPRLTSDLHMHIYTTPHAQMRIQAPYTPHPTHVRFNCTAQKDPPSVTLLIVRVRLFVIYASVKSRIFLFYSFQGRRPLHTRF